MHGTNRDSEASPEHKSTVSSLSKVPDSIVADQLDSVLAESSIINLLDSPESLGIDSVD